MPNSPTPVAVTGDMVGSLPLMRLRTGARGGKVERTLFARQ